MSVFEDLCQGTTSVVPKSELKGGALAPEGFQLAPLTAARADHEKEESNE
jgi:hypothetical protein